MTFRQLIKGALWRFDSLKNARTVPFWKSIVYLLGLSLIFALPTVYQARQAMDQLKDDSLRIAERIPEFTTENGVIKTKDSKEKGFIYQTDSIILTFDPLGKRSAQDVEKDLVGNYFSVGLLKKEAVVVFPDYNGISSSIFGDHSFTFSYKKEPLKGLTSEKLKTTLNELKIPVWTPLVMIAVGIYPALINLFVTLVITALFGAIIAKFRLRRITFFETFKTMIFCATIPTILASILQLYQPSFDSNLLITLITLFIFLRVVRSIPKIQLPTN